MTLTKIKKRDGHKEEFNSTKILKAVSKAAEAVGDLNDSKMQLLTEAICLRLTQKFSDENPPSIEQIQDVVEAILIEEGQVRISKSYILYRKQHETLRETKSLMIDINKTMDGYMDRSDWRVNENSNMGFSSSGLLMHVAGSVIANYTLKNIYPAEISDAHQNGDFHIHDLSMGMMGYCAGWSLRSLLEEGFNGVPGKLDSVPPKHFESALWQMINFIGTLQNEWAGAQAFSSFDTYLAPFIRADNLDYKKVKQGIQGFVFNMNVPSRWGGQTPFSNLTFDWTCPKDMKNKKAVVGGKQMDYTYGDCQKEMEVINRAFLEVIGEGDAKGRIFTFPIPTYNITKDFEWENPNANLLFEITAKYGTPYFQNFINSDLDPSDVRSMCCRLQMDMRKLRSRGGGLFGSAEMTGSLGVVTINLPRLGYVSKTEDELFEKLGRLMDLAKISLEIKRKVVQRNMDKGFMPFSRRYLGDLHNHFSTIGLNGMNELLQNFLGPDVTTATVQGIEFTKKVLDFMRDKLSDYQEETGSIYNLEATPAEGTSYRLAKIDREKYPEIITAGTEVPYYTNSSQLPVGYTTDVFEALDLQDEIQCKYTGGTVLHGFMAEKITDASTCKQLVKRIAENYKLPYFTITPTFSICPEHGYISGEHHSCPYDVEKQKTEEAKEIIQ